MTDLTTSDPNLPKSLLRNLYWSFSGKSFIDRVLFDNEIRQYQIDITHEDTWKPDEIAISFPQIRVMYMCWRGDDQIEPIVELISDNGQYFSTVELMFKLHNAVVEDLRKIDHHFFEGLDLYSPQNPAKPPLYLLGQGS